MGDVVKLRKSAPEPVERDGPMPEKLTKAQIERLLKLAAKKRFSFEEAHFATQRVRMWFQTSPKKRLRTDWVMVIVNSMVDGWGLRGFRDYQKRGAARALLANRVDGPRNAEGLRVLTKETIAKILEVMPDDGA